MTSYTVAKPIVMVDENNDFSGINLATNKDKPKRELFIFEEMNGQRKIEQTNGKATG